MKICLVIGLKTVITPTDLPSKMLKRVVQGVHKTIILLVVLMALKRGLFGLNEERKLQVLETEVLR
jgi:hypothetical protein